MFFEAGVKFRDLRTGFQLAACMSMLASRSLLLNSTVRPVVFLMRGIARIPHYEYHIRFDPRVGRKRPCQDVLDRFKRLNNGIWIKGQPGRHTKAYAKDAIFNETNEHYMTCTKEECMMLDKMMTPFWLRKPHYVDDPYEAYHVRHGLSSPRVDDKKRFVRERRKILLEDSIADPFFMDR